MRRPDEQALYEKRKHVALSNMGSRGGKRSVIHKMMDGTFAPHMARMTMSSRAKRAQQKRKKEEAKPFVLNRNYRCPRCHHCWIGKKTTDPKQCPQCGLRLRAKSVRLPSSCGGIDHAGNPRAVLLDGFDVNLGFRLAAVIFGVQVDHAGFGIAGAPDGRGFIPADVEAIAAWPEVGNRKRCDQDVLIGKFIDGPGAELRDSAGSGIALVAWNGLPEFLACCRGEVRSLVPGTLRKVFRAVLWRLEKVAHERGHAPQRGQCRKHNAVWLSWHG